MKTRYLILCVLGVILPYWYFVPWVAKNGLNLRLFLQQLFANRIGGFFAMDVLISAVALITFVTSESVRVNVRRAWLPIVATLAVGVSLGLPLFLYLRQSALEQSKATAKAPAVAS